MKFSKQDLLTMLIGLFLFSSCKDANTIGIAQEDGTQVLGDLYDNTLITSRTQLEDSVSTNTLVRYPLGQIHDDIFGDATASTAITVSSPNSTTFKFGTNVVIDSAILVLPYSTQFYGDTTQIYTLSVKQLTKNLSLERSFKSNINWGNSATEELSEPTPTGLQKISPKPTTGFSIQAIVTGKPDSTIAVPAQLRIKLNKSLIQSKIVNLDTLLLQKPSRFIDKFNGLYVSATATGKGGMMFFDLASASAKLQVFYKRAGTTTGTIDTVSAEFPIKSTPSAPVAAYIQHKYTNTDIKAQLADASNKQYDQTYLQALGGLRNKITFNFDDFKTKLGGAKVAINRAELIVDVAPGSSDALFKYSDRLALYCYDVAGQRRNIPDNNPASSGTSGGDPRGVAPDQFGGFFDSVNGRYIFTVTAYIQDLLEGKTQDYGTFLSPTSLTEFNVTPFATSATRTVLVKPQHDVASGTKRMKLNIFYTKLK